MQYNDLKWLCLYSIYLNIGTILSIALINIARSLSFEIKNQKIVNLVKRKR